MSVIKSAIGQDSHAFEQADSQKPLILAGVKIDGVPGMKANSDGDVILHAVTNCISGITGRNILGKIADDMCKNGITNSKYYLLEALKDLPPQTKITHLSITVECLRPKLAGHMEKMRESLAQLLQTETANVCITATTGEGLTAFGQGLGISVFAILTVEI